MKITITKPELLHAVSLHCGDGTGFDAQWMTGVLIQPEASGGCVMVATDRVYMGIGRDEDAELNGVDSHGVILPMPAAWKRYLRKDQDLIWENGEWIFHNGMKIPASPFDEMFKGWRSIVEKIDPARLTPGLNGWVDPSRLAHFARVANVLGFRKSMAARQFVRFYARGDTDVQIVAMDWRDDFRGLLMPARLREESPLVPQWLAGE